MENLTVKGSPIKISDEYKSKYSLCLGGDEGLQILFKTTPCWFHRKMVSLVFGFTWKRVR